jgi:hypothetical protein
MVVIQVQVGKNTTEDVLLDGGANVNIIIDNLIRKLGYPNQTSPVPSQNGRSKFDQTFRNHKKFEDSHTWHTI